MDTIKSKVKKLAVCSLLICFFAVSNGQQDYYGGSWRRQPSNNNQNQNQNNNNSEPSGYASINMGFVTPEGSFGEMIGSEYGNYADPGGLAFNFSLGVPINHSNFGLALMFGSYDNNYDINSFAANNDVFSLPPQSGQTDYSETSIMAGLFVTYPVGRLSIDGRLMGGALLCSLPEQDVGFLDGYGNSWETDIQPTNPTAFAFDAGIGARFLLAQFGSRKLCIMANVDYLYSSVPYSTEQDIYETFASGPNANTTAQYVPSPIVSGHLSMQLMNVTFGIGYQL